MKSTYLYLLGLAMLSACSGETKKEANQEVTEEQAKTEVCSYSFNPEAKSEVLWVSYKYTEKTGVKGVFDEVGINAPGAGESPADVLKGAEVKINTASVNSGDATRDPKIKESFFGSLADGELITGKVVSVDEAKNALTLSLHMNGMDAEVPASYSLNENHLEVKFEMNVSDWGAKAAIEALNKVCEDLHKGADGKSILWPEVTVFVSTELDKNCE